MLHDLRTSPRYPLFGDTGGEAVFYFPGMLPTESSKPEEHMPDTDSSPAAPLSAPLPFPGGDNLSGCMSFLNGTGTAPDVCDVVMIQLDTNNDGINDTLQTIITVAITPPPPCLEE